MYPAPHIHEHLATANWHEQPGAHCEQWHGHHKAHWRVQCAVLSTPRTVCWCTVFTHRTCGSRSRLVCHSMSSMHAHLCLVSWVVSPHPSLYFLIQFLFQLCLMSNSAPDEISIEDLLCNSSLGSMVTLDYVTHLTISILGRKIHLIGSFCFKCSRSLNLLSILCIDLLRLRRCWVDLQKSPIVPFLEYYKHDGHRVVRTIQCCLFLWSCASILRRMYCGYFSFPSRWWWTWCIIHLAVCPLMSVSWSSASRPEYMALLRHTMNLESDLNWVLLSFITVLAAVSRNFLNMVVITFVPLQLQFPATSLIILLLLLPIPSIFWGILILALVERIVHIKSSSLSEKSLSEYSQAALILWALMACDFVCQMYPRQVNPIHGVSSAFPFRLVVDLSWFRHFTLECFFNLVSPEIQWSEEHISSHFPDSFWTCDDARLHCWFQVHWASSVK